MRARSLFLLVALTAGIATPVHASSISITFSSSNCGTVIAGAGTSTATASHQEALGTAGSGCNSGSDLNGQVDVSLASISVALDSSSSSNVLNGALGTVVNILDSILITGGTGNGTLEMTFAVDGALSAVDGWTSYFAIQSPLLGLIPAASWRACGDLTHSTVDACPNTFGTSATVDELVTLIFPFTFGTSLDTQVQVQSNVGPNVAFTNILWNGAATAAHTAVLQPFVIRDSSGQQIGNAVALSDSGFQYAVDAPDTVSVPEPSTLMLFGIGLGAAWTARRNRRNRLW